MVLVEKGNPDGIKSYDDLKGKDVGALAGSAAEAYLRRIGANTTTFKSEVEELQSLNQGRVKYVVEDDVVFTVFDKANPGHNIEALWGIAAPDDIIYRRRLWRRALRLPQGGLHAAHRLQRRPGRAAQQRHGQRRS